MARPEDEAGEPGACRLAYWCAVAGGAITIIGGVLLVMFGILVMSAFIHVHNDILIPLSAAIFSGSALSIVGGFDAIVPR
ncbi:MAG: hypothetical protein MUO87_03180, partial [Thermoplasmata archaeon]|nr:hypothetical protein [Thermoplasmata archaeon]